MTDMRADHQIIASVVKEKSRVLDIGCADGKLLHLLKKNKRISGQGIEISHKKVESCLEKGLSVVEGDANKEIINFPKNSFDYVILSQTLQTVNKPKAILKEILRVGKNALVSFPNFGYWLCRYQLLVRGQMPVTKDLKLNWYDTQNIHLCTVKDFYQLVINMGYKVADMYGISYDNNIMRMSKNLTYLNLLASHIVFLIKTKD